MRGYVAPPSVAGEFYGPQERPPGLRGRRGLPRQNASTHGRTHFRGQKLGHQRAVGLLAWLFLGCPPVNAHIGHFGILFY